MKKVLLVVAILTSITAFGQTYESSKVLKQGRLKKGVHTTQFSDEKVVFDGKEYQVTKITEYNGMAHGKTYYAGENRHWTIAYKGKKVSSIVYTENLDGQINSIMMYGPKIKK